MDAAMKDWEVTWVELSWLCGGRRGVSKKSQAKSEMGSNMNQNREIQIDWPSSFTEIYSKDIVIEKEKAEQRFL